MYCFCEQGKQNMYLKSNDEITDEEKAYKDGYEKCLEDVYAELEKIRDSTSDFFLKNNTGEILLRLKYEFMKKEIKNDRQRKIL